MYSFPSDDHNRVKLSNLHASDYINASYVVSSFYLKKLLKSYYICSCQLPIIIDLKFTIIYAISTSIWHFTRLNLIFPITKSKKFTGPQSISQNT